ncbi:MAG TPA: hypothetical protein VFE24_02510, partial [Pirellulales bacterium]|nr:hypothetical protein [Pirellulales bacterium]
MPRLAPSAALCLLASALAATTLPGCAETSRQWFAPSQGYVLEPGPFSDRNTTRITVEPRDIVAPINS